MKNQPLLRSHQILLTKLFMPVFELGREVYIGLLLAVSQNLSRHQFQLIDLKKRHSNFNIF